MTTAGSSTLFIDDDLAFAQGAAVGLGASGFSATARHPSTVSPADVSGASLVVLDEYLEDWARPADPATTAPADGLAVGSVLRSQKPSLCVAILTGALDRLADGVPTAFGEHHIAALRDVEWVFSKQDAQSTERIAMLADAIQGIPASLTPDVLTTWLRIPDQAWADDATEHLTRCRPPLAPRQNSSGTRPLLRWLLQRALPYPTFLLTDSRTAMVLNISPSSIDTLLDGDAPALAACRYEGPLATFLGRRWWRAGLDHLVEQPATLPRLEALQERSDTMLVMPLGDNLDELVPSPVDDCVRIYPDGWPAFADQAWALRTDIFPGSLHHEMLGLTDPLWSAS